MASSLIDSELFKDQYSTKEMRAVFSERAQIQSWLDCWVALAKAEAKNGVIPESVAKEIAEKAHAEDIDMDYVREGFKKSSHPLMPQIRALSNFAHQKQVATFTGVPLRKISPIRGWFCS